MPQKLPQGHVLPDVHLRSHILLFQIERIYQLCYTGCRKELFFMNLYQLRYFVTLAKFQHYMKASEQLCITQPSLSHAISALEKELGVKLFEKDGRNVILTKCGKNFLKDAEHTLQLLDSSVERLKSSAQGNGRLDIGLLPTLGTDFVPRLIRGFLTACPDKTIDFHFYNGLTADFLEDLKNQKYGFLPAANSRTASLRLMKTRPLPALWPTDSASRLFRICRSLPACI